MPLPKLPVHSLDDINHRRRSRETINDILSHKFDDSRVQTKAEVEAGVTPVNPAFPPLDVRRYGAVGDDDTDDAPAFQAAIDVAKVRGGVIVIPTPPQSYRIKQELFLGFDVGEVGASFTIRGEGNAYSSITGYPALLTFEHSGNALDFTGGLGLFIENISITTDDVTYPDIILLLARNTDERSQNVRVSKLVIRGKASLDIIYNYGSEGDQWDSCFIFNTSAVSAARTMSITANNYRGVTSSFTTIASGQQSTIDHKVFGGEWANITVQTNADVFYLENCISVKMFGPWMLCGNESGGTNPRALIYVDSTNGSTNLVALRDITGEHSTVIQSYGIRFGGESVEQHSGWIIDGGTFPNVTAAVSAHVDAECFDFDIRKPNIQSVGGGLDFPGLLRNSTIVDPINTITIGTSRITCQSSVLTVTTRDGDIWHDVATRTWTPVNVDMVVTGALTISNTRFEYHGKQVTATLLMSAATSIVTAAGATISGLPRVAHIGAGQVIVENHTDKTVIGFGHVSGTTIVLPAINETTDQIAITATYFVA
jgi:hypothetical protein